MSLLHLTGAVAHDVELSASHLEAMPSVVSDAAAVATGSSDRAVGVADVLRHVDVAAAATHCTVISAGGDYRASIPLDSLRNGGRLAFGLGDGPLPEQLGGPYRLTVAEGSTLCWNVKHVETLKLTVGPEADDVPANPPH